METKIGKITFSNASQQSTLKPIVNNPTSRTESFDISSSLEKERIISEITDLFYPGLLAKLKGDADTANSIMKALFFCLEKKL